MLDAAYGVLDARVADHAWAGGAAFTVADCASFPVLFYTRAIHRWDDAHAGITRYYRDLLARPVGGPRRRGGPPVPGGLPAPVAGGPGRARPVLVS